MLAELDVTKSAPSMPYVPCWVSILQFLRCLDNGNFLIQGKDVWQGANGRDGEGVYLRVGPSVVVLDVQEVGCVLECWMVPVKVAHPLGIVETQSHQLQHSRSMCECVCVCVCII